MGELPEDDWPDMPALVYIEATKRPDELLKEFSDAAALHLMGRLVRETHRVSAYPVGEASRSSTSSHNSGGMERVALRMSSSIRCGALTPTTVERMRGSRVDN